MRLKPQRSWFGYIGAATLGGVLWRLIADYLLRVPFKLLESAVLGWANETLAENRVVIVEVAATVVIDWVLPLVLVAIIIFALYRFLKWHLLRQIQRAEVTVAATIGIVLEPVEQPIFQKLFSTRSLATLISLSEQGTWTPAFSLLGSSSSALGVAVTNGTGDYWNLGKEWEIEGWLTIDLPDQTASNDAIIRGLPVTVGTGRYSVEIHAQVGPPLLIRNGQLLENSTEIRMLEFTDDLESGRTYRLHIYAKYLSTT